ncbi:MULTISPECIES: hypothetical protein [Paenibacillus]|uniref:hypothetical protein n=1 Tax=Paenibacillus TaxID=44249 RepID=UPI00097B3CB5|nr:hypothetical protein [Paenibacillus macerans]MED4958689.1 hypothetical protein [Paenibacillus macerans]OMG50948.1 hypothetical protein BK140_03425 [Paenibacillus macerans]UMV46942.1 hypothetical protein LMZ02_26300 [Paenibacillus macerans]
MAYTRGNLAVKQKSAERKNPSTQRYRETTKVVTRRSTLQVREKLLYMVTIIFCVAVMAGLLWQNVTLYNIKRQMFNLNADIQAMSAEIKELTVKKEKLEEQIPEEAAKLGYVEPEVEGFHVQVPPGASTAANSETDAPSDQAGN